jgi:hypothetical protein
MCYDTYNIMISDILPGLIAILFIAIIILVPLAAIIFIQIKFIGLHRDINRMLTNPSMIVHNMYFSFIPLIGIYFYVGSVISLYNRLQEEFLFRNIPTKPRSSVFAIAFLISYFVSLFSGLVSGSNDLVALAGLLAALVELFLYFVYWTNLYNDKVKLLMTKKI